MDSKKVVKRFLSFSVGTWINAIISLVGIPIISRFISPIEYGKASMFTLAVNLFQCIVVLGIDQSFARFYNEISPEKRKFLLRDVLFPVVAISLAGIVLLQLFNSQVSLLLFDSPDYTVETNILAISILIAAILRIGLLSIRMQNKAKRYSLLQVINAISTLVSTVGYAYYAKPNFTAVIIGFAIGQIITLLLCIILDLKVWREVFHLKLNHKSYDLKPLILYGLPFIPTFIVDWFFQGIDRTFLRVYANYEALGLYAAAVKISLSLNIVQIGFTTFWMPYAYERYNTNAEETSFYNRFFNLITYAFSMLICSILVFDNILILLFPPEYYLIKSIFPFLLFVPMLYTLSEITVVGINYRKKTAYHFLIVIVAAIVNAIAAYILIPIYGATGAAVATFLAYICFFVLRTGISLNYYKVPYNFTKFIVTLAILLTFILFKMLYMNLLVNSIGLFSMMLLTLIFMSDLSKLKNLVR
ncbi:oligosaccharide flippase family protein [Chitinophaga sp.]|uniref:lipopolysaccharide biosynthesis protein n=1 Tax=Chitinophaga sp. TaxID=1869181 RepID=UPI0031E2BD20